MEAYLINELLLGGFHCIAGFVWLFFVIGWGVSDPNSANYFYEFIFVSSNQKN